MTKFKKLLALVLAFSLIVGSVSVIASAASSWPTSYDGFGTDDQISYGIKTAFYDASGNPIDRAAPGDNVKLRIWIITDYYSQSAQIAFCYPEGMFSSDYTTNTPITANATSGSFTATHSVTGSCSTNSNPYVEDDAIAENYVDESFFDEYDYFTVTGKITTSKLWNDPINWTFELDLKVTSDIDDVDTVGFVYVPEELTADPFDRPFAYTTISKTANANASGGDEFYDWDTAPIGTLDAGTIEFASKVTFNANGGTFAEGATTEYKGIIKSAFNGTAPTVATTPAGKRLVGWNTDATATAGAALPATYGYEDVTYYAIYADLAPVEITFNANQGTFAEGADTTVEQVPGKDVETPEVNRYGYTFQGWSTDSNATSGEMTLNAPDTDTTYFATWKAGTYNADFYVDGELYESVSTEFGQAIETPDDPEEPEGYTFSGWSPEVGNMTGEGLRFDGTMNPVDCPVTFVLNGGNIGGDTSDVSTTVKYDAVVSAPAGVVRTGYTLSGWKNAADENVTFTESTPVMKNLKGEVYTAQWAPNTGVSYKVTLNIMNTEGGYDSTTTTYSDGVVGQPVPYSYSAPEGFEINENSQNIGANIPESGTLEVVYNVDRVLCTVTVDNGVDAPYDVEYLYGATVADPESKDKEHETFKSWEWKDASGATISKPATMPAENITATAKFEKNTYTVTWNIDGETATTSGTNDDTFTPYTGYEEPYGYTFDGWYTDAEMANKASFPATFEENTTYYATFEPNEYKFNFFADVDNDGTDEEYASLDGKYDENIPLPEAPEKTGYEFAYWTNDYFDVFDGDEVILENSDPENQQWGDEFDFYAIFDANEYDVVFNADLDGDGEAELYETVSTYFDDVIKAPKDPKKEGYEFKGWLLDGELVEFTENGPILETEGAEFEALFEINKYTVTFVDDDGTVLKTETVEHGKAAAAPANPADREDEYFTGWDKSFDNITTDTTVTAVYGDNVTITFVADSTTIGTFSGKPGSAFTDTVPTASKEGYSFTGWTPEFNNVYPSTSTTYTAVLEANEYTINYVVDGKATDLKTTAKCDATITLETYTPAAGYDFNGWYTDEACTTPATITTMPANGATLYGKTVGQDGIKVTVEYYYMDTEGNYPETATSTATQYGTTGETVTAEYTVPQGYSLDSANSTLSDKVKGDGSLVLKVCYERNQYTLTTVVDGTTSTKKVYYDAAVSVADPDVEGKDFTGWTWTETEGGAEISAPATMPAKDITATASFKTQTFTVTFVDWDGAVLKTETVDYGKAATAPADPNNKEGHDFTGWSPADFSNVKSDLTVTAVYGVQSFEVKFVDYDGTVLSTQNVEYGNAATAPADPDNKEGYSFTSWDKSFDNITADTTVTALYEINSYDVTYYVGTEAVYTTEAEFGSEFPEYTIDEDDIPEGYTFEKWVDEAGNDLPDTVPAKDVVIVAKLNAIEYTATFNATEGEFADSTKTKDVVVAYGSAITAPAAPTREGYIFAGWDPKVPATMPAGDVTFNATWMEKPSEYYVTFVVDGETYDAYTVEVGAEIPLPEEPEKFGYKFDGWDPEVPAEMPEQNMTFTAKWRIDETLVTVVVGGTVIGAVALGSIAAMNAAAITGVSIIGGVVVIWLASEFLGDIEAKEEFTVTYLVDGELYAEYVVAVGDDIPVPADPSKDGATFLGWNPEIPEEMPANDLVFNAEFEDADDNDDVDGGEDEYIPEGDGDADPDVPETGSASTALAIMAGLSAAAAAAFITRKKKDEDAE